jgi:hypothetical protein
VTMKRSEAIEAIARANTTRTTVAEWLSNAI